MERETTWMEKSNLSLQPNTLHKPGVKDFLDELPRMAHFIWMIAWVWEYLIGNEIPYVFHHSYLEEAIGKQECFHIYLPFSHDESHLVYPPKANLDTWQEPLGGKIVVEYLKQWWRLFDEEATRGGGENFSQPL